MTDYFCRCSTHEAGAEAWRGDGLQVQCERVEAACKNRPSRYQEEMKSAIRISLFDWFILYSPHSTVPHRTDYQINVSVIKLYKSFIRYLFQPKIKSLPGVDEKGNKRDKYIFHWFYT